MRKNKEDAKAVPAQPPVGQNWSDLMDKAMTFLSPGYSKIRKMNQKPKSK